MQQRLLFGEGFDAKHSFLNCLLVFLQCISTDRNSFFAVIGDKIFILLVSAARPPLVGELGGEEDGSRRKGGGKLMGKRRRVGWWGLT